MKPGEKEYSVWAAGGIGGKPKVKLLLICADCQQEAKRWPIGKPPLSAFEQCVCRCDGTTAVHYAFIKGFRIRRACGHYENHEGLLSRDEAEEIARSKCFACWPETNSL